MGASNFCIRNYQLHLTFPLFVLVLNSSSSYSAMSDTLSQFCKKCNTAIFEGHAYELGDDRWHINCFKCSKCESSLGCNSNFLVLGNGSLICSECSYNCKQCAKKIDDLAILTGDQAYCLSCFRCRVCKLKIEDLRYARTLKGLFCMSCHEKLVAKKKKYDLKRRQMAQLELLLRPNPEDSPSISESDPSIYVCYHGNTSQASVLRDKVLPHPPRAQTPPLFSMADDFGSGVSVATSNDIPIDLSGISVNAPDIEEVNDSDDELALRKARERLRRRFDRLVQNPSHDLGAILDLITSFSGPNTPSTMNTAFDAIDSTPLGKSPYKSPGRAFDPISEREIRPELWNDKLGNDTFSVKLGDNAPNKSYKSGSGSERALSSEMLADGDEIKQNGEKKTGPSLVPPGDSTKSILLLSPNQFHDHEFHSQNDAIHLNSYEDIPRRSAASSPMAKANRQARVLETNEEAPAADLDIDPPFMDLEALLPEITTPKKTPAPPVAQMVSPPPRLALPNVPATPLRLADFFEPRGLGLEGVELLRNRATPAVTNLEDTIDGDPDHPDDKFEIKDGLDTERGPLSRRNTSRGPKILLKHKRSTSGLGLGLTRFFKSKEEEPARGHTRHVLDSSVAQNLAFTTPPLPLSSPLRQGGFRETHTRSTSDTPFLISADAPKDYFRLELELRSLKLEVSHLENSRQNLLADNVKLNLDKNKLQEAIKSLQKKMAAETQSRELLLREINDLVNEKKRLTENNLLLQESVDQQTSRHAEVAPIQRQVSIDVIPEVQNSSSSLSLPFVDEENSAETNKATRLKFWKKPKVTISPTPGKLQLTLTISKLVNSTTLAILNLLQFSHTHTTSNGTIPTSQSSYKLSQSYSSIAIQHPSQLLHTTGEHVPQDYSARKALSSFMSKSRSTTILDSFVSPGGAGDAPLFSSTIQKRAIYENERVPVIISKCLEEVEMRGLENEGIYRISGGNSAIVAIENGFAALPANFRQDKRQTTRLNEALAGDINAVTSALKRYLRKLPDPLIPFSLYDEFVRVGQSKTDTSDRCLDMVTRVLNKVPPANKQALYLLGKHMDLVNQNSGVNRMNFKNLSVVFAPTIARDATGEKEMIDMGPRNEATELLFSNFSTIFASYEG